MLLIQLGALTHQHVVQILADAEVDVQRHVLNQLHQLHVAFEQRQVAAFLVMDGGGGS